MMDTQLTLPSMIKRTEKFFPTKEVISRTHSGVQRLTYKEIVDRMKRLGHALESLGVTKGDRVGTFGWNHHRHLEAYFAVPSIGAVLHTINFRLSAEHIEYIINHAEDKVLLIDEDVLPLIENIQDKLETVEAFIIMTDQQSLPETSLSPVYSYEDLLEKADDSYEFTAEINEYDPAGLCYTSGTTGKPKGVEYTHRGIYLHSMSLALTDTVALSESDVCLPAVPMFHVNAWGMPFVATWLGATQVFPGPNMTPKLIAEMIDEYNVTFSAGVPTIWLGLLQELEQGNYDMSSVRAMLCGGSAAPKGMIQAFESKFGISFLHGYGLTETSPLVSVTKIKSTMEDYSDEEKLEVLSKQGLVVPGIEIKAINENGEIQEDGEDMGELLIRGPWIADSYYKADRNQEAFQDGWFHTGDVVTIDEEGIIKIVDRTKDLIKSGGEWISSVDLENAMMAHESVLESAVVAVPDDKWQERPVACVVLKKGPEHNISKEEILEFIRPQFASWWLPDEVLFVDEIPKTSVGKFLKAKLREDVLEELAL